MLSFPDPTTQELLYGFVENYLGRLKDLNGNLFSSNEDPSFHIIKLNLQTGDRMDLGEGINPSWSQDATQIAYIGFEGLYTMGANGDSPILLQEEYFFDQRYPPKFSINAPIPRWSPDGRWLLYHGCNQSNCESGYSIYKIPTNGGAAQILVSGGMNPNWKP